jgi:hypothetical protein
LESDRRTADIAETPTGVPPACLLFSRKVTLVAVTCLVGACQPSVVVGQWTCPASSADAGPTPVASDPVTIPWSTGFENRFCDYTQAAGFCLATGLASYGVVTSPARAGSSFAAAYTVTSQEDADGGAEAGQSRCVRQGILPKQAYYGAWYYIPATATNASVWNLFHFQGGDPPTSPPAAVQTGLPNCDKCILDVSLVNDATGQLRMVLHVFTNNLNQTAPVAIPIGSWFHIEVFLKRAGDATGEAALYQDGTRVADFANVITDATNWGQWYVGNYADGLTPPESTVYVDDVTISATLAKP